MGIHWQSQDHLCIKKEEGGLGFRHLHNFNLALLAKHDQSLYTQLTYLVTRILKAKCFPQQSFLHARLRNNPSYVWKGFGGLTMCLLWAVDDVWEIVARLICGLILFLRDSPNFQPTTPIPGNLQHLRVADLWL